MEYLQDVSSLSGQARVEPVSDPLQTGIRFFLLLTPVTALPIRPLCDIVPHQNAELRGQAFEP
ncbi:hypothetical protein DSCO28_68150 [Desulfosarcina ovata subsp. sediminis]|uniref:Uncharacterized protein n=1 Tax=Desulfosarcina ovata subsp. sediminis TaxID=885957 RepID=A0A5K8A108_9BACT|nr:hypothetical protein DSCO28_68150 [Desulfosarcina ovata subsp. sediminis]